MGQKSIWLVKIIDFSMYFSYFSNFAHFAGMWIRNIKMCLFKTCSVNIKMFHTHWTVCTCLSSYGCILAWKRTSSLFKIVVHCWWNKNLNLNLNLNSSRTYPSRLCCSQAGWLRRNPQSITLACIWCTLYDTIFL